MEHEKGKLELISTQRVHAHPEMYKVVDFLNKNLKEHHLMFGLTKKEESMVISIYEVD
ncbi:YpmA family protein [Desulfitobacterium sp.]|uniref:YpmA family protein n=1 Tax=Desulfitobacterium sp. TaxID=49981 RepID=UPI002C06221C|nr:YpmA family protein [Desulfitobacterium sp.]HVJ48707.1 YpmA family protein [Desulfitobacterium sp.]